MGTSHPRGVLLLRRGVGIAIASFAAIASFWLLAAPARADVTAVSGGAFGESVNVTPLEAANVKSGPLPTVTLPAAGGGPFTNSALSACVPSPGCALLQAGVLNVSTQGSTGATGGSQSSASVANVDALKGSAAELTATAVSSQCRVTGNSASGSTTLVGGSFGGQSLAANPPPNTTLSIDGITLILNEQKTTGGPGNFSMTVNAVHLILSGELGSGDIIISQSRCGERGPNVTIPFAPIGIVGTSAVVGAVLVRRQWKRHDGDGASAAGKA
jgi:hypothetical protein